MSRILSHFIAAYIGAGLSLGLIMAQVLPLNGIGVAAYALTWPRHVYCARPGADCFGLATYLPEWIAAHLFTLTAPGEDPQP